MIYKVYTTVEYSEVYEVEATSKEEAKRKVLDGEAGDPETLYDNEITSVDKIEEVSK